MWQKIDRKLHQSFGWLSKFSLLFNQFQFQIFFNHINSDQNGGLTRQEWRFLDFENGQVYWYLMLWNFKRHYILVFIKDTLPQFNNPLDGLDSLEKLNIRCKCADYVRTSKIRECQNRVRNLTSQEQWPQNFETICEGDILGAAVRSSLMTVVTLTKMPH